MSKWVCPYCGGSKLQQTDIWDTRSGYHCMNLENSNCKAVKEPSIAFNPITREQYEERKYNREKDRK